MHLTKRIIAQLAFFTVITLTGGAIMIFGYMGLPNLLFGVGHYEVTMKLPAAAGLYGTATSRIAAPKSAGSAASI